MTKKTSATGFEFLDFLRREDVVVDENDRHSVQALEDAKQQGLELAVTARLVAVVVLALALPLINPNPEVLYYHGILVLFGAIGLIQRRIGVVGRSRAEFALILCDILLVASVTFFPNPFQPHDLPIPMQYRFGGFIFFFIILTGATLSYSWRTLIAIGHFTAGIWIIGSLAVHWLVDKPAHLTDAAHNAFGEGSVMAGILDPNAILVGVRIQEVVVIILCAYVLAVTVRRSGDLLRRHAAVERERMNLSRYFSPNVVDELSRKDEPLKQVRTQNVAVLFADIVGFTEYANREDPAEVIETLRLFHGRMESEVFAHNGTLDKYLGDGLMATFGTPFAGEQDANNALQCANAMIDAVNDINRERKSAGLPEIRASFGVHYGPVVLGDIGANRLEFAVIGNTVNVASRLEGLTRKHGCSLVVSDVVLNRARGETGLDEPFEEKLKRITGQKIRGVEKPMIVWAK